MAFDYDYIVIGSGFGGSVSALRLTEKGYRVAVVEMGRRFGKDDFAKTTWDARRFLWRPALGCHGIMQMTLLDDVFVLHGAGVGGGSLVYANTLLVPPAEAFAAWPVLSSASASGRDWQATLRPHYATARRMLGVTTAPRVYHADEILRDVAGELGRAHTFHPTEVGVYFGEPGQSVPDPYFGGSGPSRVGCIHCGACMVGCRVGAKNTLDQNYLYFAERGGAQVLAERQVTELEPLAGGGYRITMRPSVGGGATEYLTGRGVVLAAGVLGTVPLLLRSRRRGHLPRLSDQLGNFVRTNSEALLAVRSRRDDVDYSKGIAIAAGVHIDDTTHIEVVRYNEGSDALALLGTVLTDGGPPWPRWLRWVGTMLRHPRWALRSLLPWGWARRTAILLVMQPVDSFLRLVERRRWLAPWTRRIASEQHSHRPIPVYFPVANEVARRMATRMDGMPQSGLVEVLGNRAMTAHILGGCPMGTTAKEGVIDGECRVHGYPDLLVVDGSAVPGNLGVNPSLTICAIAEHAMSHISGKDR